MSSNVAAEHNEELIDYEEDEALQVSAPVTINNNSGSTAVGGGAKDGPVKKGYVGIHSTGFRDFLLKPELLRAIGDCGFEHPSEGKQKRENELEWDWSEISPTRVYSSGYFGNGRPLPS